jgi:hypothetical protein
VSRKLAWAAAGLAAMVLAAAGAGCGGEDEPEPASGEERNGEVQVTTSPTEQETSTAAEPEPEEPPEALAASEGAIDGHPVRLEVTELARTGAIVALTFRLTMDDPLAEENSDSAQLSDTFDDGYSEQLGATQDTRTLDGISLIDAENRKRHLVARDSEGVCGCDGELGGAFLDPGAPLTLSATFAAPPEDVEAVDVVIPRFGTLKDVPLS